MAEKQINGMIDSLMQGIDGLVSTKTVVGEPTTIGDTIIIPLVDVSFGMGVGAGASTDPKKEAAGGGGVTGKMSPSAVLVISNGMTRLINVRTTDNVSRALDLIPEIIHKIKPDKVSDDEIIDSAFPEDKAQ
ncbi:MAG: GerW family sporulation protein [Lachnospiraceae bacterium]|nr:GerW family sporulation protein [Lachnospiraceae bacterium]